MLKGKTWHQLRALSVALAGATLLGFGFGVVDMAIAGFTLGTFFGILALYDGATRLMK